ncbi:MAG TPA: BON domain-containing protein, partial [Terriglobales bacterium]|nr:BON domain-containing protein [Terriglobales bacterium]
MGNFPWKNISYAVIAIAVAYGASLGFRALSNREKPAEIITVDSDVQKDIELALASSDAYAHEKIAVTVKDGEATLTGVVHEQWKQMGAANVAATIPGVKLVKNLIQVREGAHQKEAAPWTGSAEASSSPGGETAAKTTRMITQTPEDKARARIDAGQARLARKNYDEAIKDFQ